MCKIEEAIYCKQIFLNDKKVLELEKFIELKNYIKLSETEMLVKSEIFNQLMQTRRTVREFSPESINLEVINNCIQTANSAPSGANKQPWHFVMVKSPKLKNKIRVEAEKEEREFYGGKATKEWLTDLEPFETNEIKPFLEEAPILIAIFEEKYSIDEEGKHHKNYYTKESVGIATGMLITAIHNAGLASLTHTPSPMNFLNEILERPKNEKPFLLLVVGYPKEGTMVPNIKRKTLEKITTIK
ncbi:MAG: nitroreductase family protein [Melioribacteraceae bacterium]|nr:nitroreductase family protein [Melioribacteraceae bacterium]